MVIHMPRTHTNTKNLTHSHVQHSELTSSGKLGLMTHNTYAHTDALDSIHVYLRICAHGSTHIYMHIPTHRDCHLSQNQTQVWQSLSSCKTKGTHGLVHQQCAHGLAGQKSTCTDRALLLMAREIINSCSVRMVLPVDGCGMPVATVFTAWSRIGAIAGSAQGSMYNFVCRFHSG